MSLLDEIFQAGIVGCGGAGFPTHAKFKGEIEHLILNGAECEPLLRTDRYLMRHKAVEIVTAAGAVREAIGAKDCTIALKKAYVQEIAALEAAIDKTGLPVRLHTMESFYPAGDEQVMVYEVTGRVVPPAGIPLDVGAAVSNVATMVAIYDAMEGKPFLWKYLTITGEVKTPAILHVPVGTSIPECIRLAGGAKDEEYFVVAGGPMMGAPMTMEQAQRGVVSKTTSGLLVLPAEGYLAQHNKISLEHMMNRAAAACIQCSYCTELCPRHLLGHPLEPHKIMRKMAMNRDLQGLLDDPDIQKATLCCECGVCELYACPMGLQPRRINAILKDELGKAGIRYPKTGEETIPLRTRRDRKIPTRRAASRAGVLDYYDLEIDTLIEGVPERVELALKQNIGAPAQAVVAQGDFVTAGQLIGKCPQGKLGANLHASISGTVQEVTHRIVIEGRA